MAIELPDLDLRDEDEVVADVIDALPVEISDRNRSNPEIKLIEACGAFYGATLVQLNKWTKKLSAYVLTVLGIEQELATSSSVDLEFTADVAGATIPAGTIVKTGLDADAVKFSTDAALVLGASATDTVASTAVDEGADGNVAADTLIYLDQPVAGVVSVTNPLSASGGQDDETIAAMEARAPLAIRALERAITDEDFAYHAARIDGIERAIAFGDGSGSVVVHILATDLNEAPSSTLTDGVKTDLEGRTLPGVVVTSHQPALRQVRLTEVEVALSSGASSSTVAGLMTEAMGEEVTAVDLFDTDGVTILHDAWDWGRTLYVNDLIALLDGVDGVDRVGTITGEYSDDYGATWSGPVAVTSIAAGADGFANSNYGLLHYDTGAADPTIVEL